MKKIFPFLVLLLLAFNSCEKSDTTASTGGTTGVGGSLARFTITMNHLYIVDQANLYTYSLAVPDHPQIKSTINLSWNIETIYPFKDKLFIGSQNGMYVYSLSNPDNPELLGQASHVRSCDPVVANDSIAYVTIRGGSACGGNTNALIVYSVKDVINPVERRMINLNNPYGLGLGNNKRLYVCNGTGGLIVYDITDPVNPQFIKNITGEHFYDIIVLDDMLVCMVENGTAIYTVQPGDIITPAGKISN
jgi:hypothetical protein